MEGQEFCDFIGNLLDKGITLVIENILDTLCVSSLKNAAKVSRRWEKAILHETRNQLRHLKDLKENWENGSFTKLECDLNCARRIQMNNKLIVVFTTDGENSTSNIKINVYNRTTMELEFTLSHLLNVPMDFASNIHLTGPILSVAFKSSGDVIIWNLDKQEIIQSIETENESLFQNEVFVYTKIGQSKDTEIPTYLASVMGAYFTKGTHLLTLRKFQSPTDLTISYKCLLAKEVKQVKDVFVDNNYIVLNYEKKSDDVYGPIYVDVRKSETGHLMHSISINRQGDTFVSLREKSVYYYGGTIVVFDKKLDSRKSPQTFRFLDVKSGTFVRKCNIMNDRFGAFKHCSIVMNGKFLISPDVNGINGPCYLNVWDLEKMILNPETIEADTDNFLVCSLDLQTLKLWHCKKVIAHDDAVLIIGERYHSLENTMGLSRSVNNQLNKYSEEWLNYLDQVDYGFAEFHHSKEKKKQTCVAVIDFLKLKPSINLNLSWEKILNE